jgi:SAM-dependent methyltransferase
MSAPITSNFTLSTLHDYTLPANFNMQGTPIENIEMPEEKILESIQASKIYSSVGKSLEEAVPEYLYKITQIIVASQSIGISPLTTSFLKSYRGKGTALDVGCGIGLNSVALFSRGWTVYPLDLYQELLDIFKKNISDLKAEKKTESANLGKFKTINGDITKIKLETNKIDLVLAFDVLSYIHPDDLIPTIKKIYATLLPGGLFMGSFLVHRALKTDRDIDLMAKIYACNSYSYTNPTIVANILQYAGFYVERSSLQENIFPQPEHPADIVTFVARKIESQPND